MSSAHSKTHLVIGSPVFNEANGIIEYLHQIDSLAQKLNARWPHLKITSLLMDDGSTDATVEKASQYNAQYLSEIEIHRLSRNFGPYPAISAIFHTVKSDAIVIMDADLQDSPDVVIQLVTHWMEGFECVRVLRGKRHEGWLHGVASRMFYRSFGKLSGLSTHIGTFGLYSWKVIEAFKLFPERTKYFPGIISLAGFKTQHVLADRARRFEGNSRVGIRRLVQFALTAAVSFSSIPIHFITILGMATAFVSGVSAFFIIGIRIFSDYSIPGWASILSAQFLLGGLIIFSLGVVGQYIGIIFNEVKNRPEFIIASSTKRSFPEAFARSPSQFSPRDIQ